MSDETPEPIPASSGEDFVKFFSGLAVVGQRKQGIVHLNPQTASRSERERIVAIVQKAIEAVPGPESHTLPLHLSEAYKAGCRAVVHAINKALLEET